MARPRLVPVDRANFGGAGVAANNVEGVLERDADVVVEP